VPPPADRTKPPPPRRIVPQVAKPVTPDAAGTSNALASTSSLPPRRIAPIQVVRRDDDKVPSPRAAMPRAAKRDAPGSMRDPPGARAPKRRRSANVTGDGADPYTDDDEDADEEDDGAPDDDYGEMSGSMVRVLL
jgi:hypothetical protein